MRGILLVMGLLTVAPAAALDWHRPALSMPVESGDAAREREAAGSPTANANWFDEAAKGYWWYKWQEPAAKKKPREKEREQAPAEQTPPLAAMPPIEERDRDPMEELKALQAAFERAQARATLHPSEQNVREYLELQHAVQERAALLADVGKRVVWANPQLDGSLNRPLNPDGLRAWTSEYERTKRERFAELAKNHGLFFFFSSTCPYCEAFAPYVRQFAEKYRFDVVAVSVDGPGIAMFPAPLFKPALTEAFGVNRVPALFLVEPKRREVQPLAFGPISESELERRLFDLTVLQPGETIYRVNSRGTP